MNAQRLLIVLIILSSIVLGFSLACGLGGSVLHSIAQFLDHIALTIGDVARDGVKASSVVLILSTLGYVTINEKRTG